MDSRVIAFIAFIVFIKFSIPHSLCGGVAIYFPPP